MNLETQHALAEQPEGWLRAQSPGGRGAAHGLKLNLSAGLPWMVAGLSFVVAVISVALLWRATLPADRPMTRFSIDLGREAIRGRSDSGEFFNPAISPDGTRLVFPAKAADGPASN